MLSLKHSVKGLGRKEEEVGFGDSINHTAKHEIEEVVMIIASRRLSPMV